MGMIAGGNHTLKYAKRVEGSSGKAGEEWLEEWNEVSMKQSIAGVKEAKCEDASLRMTKKVSFP